MNIKKYAAASAMIALMAAPAFASAQSVTASTSVGVDLSVQVKSLLGQIQALQQQLKALLSQAGSSTIPWAGGDNSQNPGQQGKQACITLSRTITVGSQGEDVKNIQQLLSSDKDSDFHGGITGFFGPLTAKAFAKFQVNNGIASSSDGTAGPKTRAFFERRCGKGLDGERGAPQGQGGQPGIPGEHGNVLFIGGTISAASASSITIGGPDGKSQTFAITASTTIEVGASSSTPAHAGTVADLVVGVKAQVQGTGDSANPTAVHIRVGEFAAPQGGPQGGLITTFFQRFIGDDHGGPGQQGGQDNAPSGQR